MKPRRIWVLVADAGKALIVKYPRQTEQSPEDVEYRGDEKRLGEIMADRPGRSFASIGRRRSGMEYHSDPLRQLEAQFAGRLTADIGHAHRDGAFDDLVLVAEPRMLGLLRDALPEALKRHVVLEIDKDLVKLPRKALLQALAETELSGLNSPSRPLGVR